MNTFCANALYIMIFSFLYNLDFKFRFSSFFCAMLQLVEGIGVPDANHRLTPCHWQLTPLPWLDRYKVVNRLYNQTSIKGPLMGNIKSGLLKGVVS